jgi:hypothetical protein
VGAKIAPCGKKDLDSKRVAGLFIHNYSSKNCVDRMHFFGAKRRAALVVIF